MTHRANLKEFSQDIRHPSSARLPESVMTSRKKMSECLQTQRSKSTFGDQLKTQKLTHARRLSEAKGVQCLENHLAKLFSGDLLPLDLDFSKKGNRQGAK